MRTPIKSSFSLYNTPDGGFLVRRVLFADGPEQSQLALYDYKATPQLLANPNSSVGIKKVHPTKAYLV